MIWGWGGVGWARRGITIKMFLKDEEEEEKEKKEKSLFIVLRHFSARQEEKKEWKNSG